MGAAGVAERAGPFEILERLAVGGPDRVYRARDTRGSPTGAGLGEEVAVKVFVLGEDAAPDEVRRFFREVALARDLDHPGILPVLEWGEEGGRAWFARRHVPGRTLAALLRENVIPCDRALAMARDLADALAAAHAKGVLHRDVSPATVWVDLEGRPHLCDFGLAKSVTTGSKYTRTGVALGNPRTMSPEQARGEIHGLAPATDVWGLGCILYEMLAGRPPFDADSPAGIVAQVLLREPVRLRRLRPDAPVGARILVRVCLAKRAVDRYADGAALRDDLDRVIRGGRPSRSPPRSRAWWFVPAGIVAVAAAWGIQLAWPAAPTELRRPGAERTAGEALAARAKLLRSTDPREAAQLLGEALASEPERHEWRLERGLCLWSVGQAEEAREEWRRIPEASREGTKAILYRGLEALFRLEGPDAVPVLEKVARVDGPEGRLARGALALLRHDWAGGREALRAHPGWEAALLRACIESWDPAGDRCAAIREYDEALAQGMPFSWVFTNRGVAREGVGDLAGAMADFEAALRLAPRNAQALVNRGRVRQEVGDLPGAIEDLGCAIEVNPRHAEAYVHRGRARQARDDLIGAIADFDAALQIDPRLVRGLVGRGTARRAAGDLAGAIQDFDRAIQIGPRLSEAYLHRGAAREAQGDLAAAIADYDEARRNDPRDAAALAGRARVRQALGDLRGALEDLDEAHRLRADDPGILYARGALRLTLGDSDGAISDLEEALRLRPDSPDAPAIRVRLAVARAARGDR